jgi:hypothetical protein
VLHRINAPLNLSIERTCPGKPGHASHLHVRRHKVNALSRYVLLKDWSNTTGDLGSYVFLIGKVIGIIGRLLGVLFVPAAVIGSLASTTVLFFVGYGAGFVAIVALLIEVCARLLMIAGNAVSARLSHSGN